MILFKTRLRGGASVPVRLTSTAVLATLSTIPAMAQEAANLPDVDIVSADEQSAPALSGERLSRPKIQSLATGSSDTAKLLQSVPGVSGFGAGGVSTLPVIRGLEAQRLNVLVDGVNIASACPNDMNPPLSYTDPQTVRSIDVITGVSPVSWGGDSIGGIVSVETAPPRFAE